MNWKTINNILFGLVAIPLFLIVNLIQIGLILFTALIVYKTQFVFNYPFIVPYWIFIIMSFIVWGYFNPFKLIK